MQRMWLTIIAVSLILAICPSTEAAQPLWQKFIPQKRQALSTASEDSTLTKENGPWLIMATSFNGEDAEQQARNLVAEIRTEYGLPAFYYGMTFQIGGEKNPGKGLDIYGSKIKRRYQRPEVREHAVLVGEFPSLGDAEAQKLLKKIKKLTPPSMVTNDSENSSQLPETVQQMRRFLQRKANKDNQKGPLAHAFITRNPLLPKEYFAPRGIDEDIAKWNENLEYSLMKCPGKYSVRVATFRGRSTLKRGNEEIENTKTRKATKDDPLVVAGKNAHLLTVALREKGWEAYEFHDRHESYVTIGSFNSIQERNDAAIVLTHPNAKIIIDTFGAHTPNNIFNRPAPEDLRREQERKAQFKSLFSQGRGQVAEGFHPKRFVGLPLDIQPAAVQVPRRSISSVYAHK